MSTVIRNGTVVTADRQWKADVLIEGETIAAIGDGLTGDETIDATDAYVIPGGIDPHTHLEMPFMGTTAAETFESGTFAAAAGGTTMLVDFVLPGEDGLLAAVDDWDAKSKDRICTDISYHMAITGWSRAIWEEMEAVVKDRGINTFKHFMAYKGALMVEDDEMFASFTRCAELGALPLVHAENGDVVAALQEKYLGLGVTGPEGHAYSRPPEVEGEAANRAIMIADAAADAALHRARLLRTGARGHPPRPAEGHARLRRAADPAPHARRVRVLRQDWQYAARRVMSPPFRDKKHQDSLWAGLASGSLHVVATDHAAFSDEQKRMGVDDFTRIPNGTGGLEERMAMLWTKGVDTGRLTPEEFVAVTTTNIAKILNIYPTKGAITVGGDADVVVWDPSITRTVSVASQKSIIDYNVFEGMELTAAPRFTLSRGEVIWAHGQNSQPRPGRGRFVRRPPFAERFDGAGQVEVAELAAEGGAGCAEYSGGGLAGLCRWGSSNATASASGENRSLRSWVVHSQGIFVSGDRRPRCVMTVLGFLFSQAARLVRSESRQIPVTLLGPSESW